MTTTIQKVQELELALRIATRRADVLEQKMKEASGCSPVDAPVAPGGAGSSTDLLCSQSQGAARVEKEVADAAAAAAAAGPSAAVIPEADGEETLGGPDLSQEMWHVILY